MKRYTKQIVQGGLLTAIYVALTYAQNLLWPDSATMAVQFRLSEALCVFAFFTPASIYGLSLGCLLFNLSSIGALPFDFLVGTAATFLATGCMWKLRGKRVLGLPLLGLLMPALWNAPLVGLELTLCLADRFSWGVFGMNALFVFLGEAAVLLVLGSILFHALDRGLAKRLLK